MDHDLQQIPDELLGPAFPVNVLPPVRTNAQELPYALIPWQAFERLCIRLIDSDSELRGCRRYGEQGNEQAGIDIFAYRDGSGKYTVCQCKNVAEFGPADIREAVKLFVQGEWLTDSDRLVLAMRDKVNTKARCDEVAAQTKLLSGHGVEFEVWDGEGLDLKLKGHPEIVRDFFGPAWAGEFCGAEGRGMAVAVLTEATPEERNRIAGIIESMTQ